MWAPAVSRPVWPALGTGKYVQGHMPPGFIGKAPDAVLLTQDNSCRGHCKECKHLSIGKKRFPIFPPSTAIAVTWKGRFWASHLLIKVGQSWRLLSQSTEAGSLWSPYALKIVFAFFYSLSCPPKVSEVLIRPQQLTPEQWPETGKGKPTWVRRSNADVGKYCETTLESAEKRWK